MHVRVDQAGVDVALGLNHHGIGRLGSGVGRLVAFVRQRQTRAGQGRFGATGWGGQLASDGTPAFWIHTRSQLDGLMRFQASRAACLARSQLRLDVPRLVAQSLDIWDSTSSKSRPGYWVRASTPKP